MLHFFEFCVTLILPKISRVQVLHLKFCALLLYLQHVRNTTPLILPDFIALINTWWPVPVAARSKA